MTKPRDLATLGGGFTQSGTGAIQRTVENKLKDTISVKDFGAVGDGVTDDAPEIQAALNYAIANDKALYFPEGIYLVDGTGLTNSRIEPTITNNSSIILFGAGPGKTIIKEKNASVLNLGANHFTLYFNVPASTTVNNLIVTDMTLDKNGASNGSPPTSYAWEQAHILRVAVNSTGTLRYVSFRNLELLDKVGAGIAFSSGRVLNAEVQNCHARNFSSLFGQRGDFEFQAAIDNLSITHCSGLYAQAEPTVAPPAGVTPNATIRNCLIDTMEFTGYSSDPTLQTTVIDSCVANTKLTIRNSKVIATNSRFQVGSASSEYWSRVSFGSVVSNCTIVTRYDSGTNSVSPFYPRSETTVSGFYLTIKDSNFVPGAGASGTTTGSAISNAAVYTGATPYSLKLVDCTFSSLYEQTINAYRNGIYEMIRCKIAGWGSQAIQVGGETTRYGQLTLNDCDFSQVTATKLVAILNSNALWKLTWRGSHDYAKYSHSGTGTPELYTAFEGIFVSSSAPAANGIKGMIVRVLNPTLGNASEYACTVTSATTATFRMSQQFGQKKDTTANRPTLTTSDIGAFHLDTTLDADGKPIWWTGTAWVDATGAVV